MQGNKHTGHPVDLAKPLHESDPVIGVKETVVDEMARGILEQVGRAGGSSRETCPLPAAVHQHRQTVLQLSNPPRTPEPTHTFNKMALL